MVFESGTSMRASPSAIKTAQKCLRQWAFRTFGGFPRIDQPWFQAGRELDKYGEEYLKTGVRPAYDTPMSRLFHEGIKHLPEPGLAATQVALSWRLAGYEIFGFADFLICDPSYLDGKLVLGDLKTTGNPAYDLTIVTLPKDPQCFAYSGAIFQDFGVDTLHARWLYHDKRSVRARPVDVTITAKTNEEHARKIALPVLDSMAAIRQADPRTIAEINEVPNDPTACGGCGKHCDYAAHCTIYRKGSPTIMTVQERIDAMRAKAAQAKGLAPESAPAQTAAQTEIATPPAVAQSAAAPQVAALTLPTPATTQTTIPSLTLPGAVVQTTVAPVNAIPAGAPAPAPVAPPAAPPAEEKPKRGRKPKAPAEPGAAVPFSFACSSAELAIKLELIANALEAGGEVTVTL